MSDRLQLPPVPLEVHALYLAGQDRRVPTFARALATSVSSYALSPAKLMPATIPPLRRLDEEMVVPFAVRCAANWIPAELWAEHLAEATRRKTQPQSRTAAYVVIAIWSTLTMLVCWLAYRDLSK